MVRTVVAGLLMLATLLVYAMPGHAGSGAHRHVAVHEHAVGHADAANDANYGADATVQHDHAKQAPCPDDGLRDDGSCCSVAHCASMHGGLPAIAAAAVVPKPGGSHGPAELATPEGILPDPALRPPCLTV